MTLQVSGKDLGALAMRDFCPRCFWISRRLGWNAVSALALVYTEPVTTDEAAAGEAPPAGREGCPDCGYLERIRGLPG